MRRGAGSDLTSTSNAVAPPAQSRPPLIELEGWGWRHAGRAGWAVRDLTCRIEPGQRVLLLGASGAGKSTLLRALAGLLGGADEGEEAGRLRLDGQPADRQPGRTGLVMQDPASQLVLARAGDDVAFGCENLGLARDLIWPRVRSSLDAVGLSLPFDHDTGQLSGGQRQRLVLAGVLAMGPDLLLLDEPTANLDPAGVLEVRQAVADLVADRRRGLIVVEHRSQTWLPLIDRVLVLAPDGLLADGPPDQVFDRHGPALAELGVWTPGQPLGLSPRPAAPATATILSGRGLTIGHDPLRPVQAGLDLDLPRGQSTVLTGPNGAGKTTLALTLAGLLPRLGGDLAMSEPEAPPGRPDPASWRSRELLTRLGTVFQEPEHQFVASTVEDEVAVGLRALGRPPAEVARQTAELLERLHLAQLGQANPYTLSGGEKRRLSVATVLATSPAVVVLDEPTFGQDRRTWISLVRLIDQLLDQGVTVISSTHDDDYIALLGQHRLELSPQVPPPVAGPTGPSSEQLRPPPRRVDSRNHPLAEGADERAQRPGPAAAEPDPTQSERPTRFNLLQRVNPTSRIAAALIVTLPMLISLDWVSGVVAVGLELAVCLVLGWRPAALARRLWPLALIAPVTAIGPLLYGRPGGRIYLDWWLVVISQQSVSLALAVLIRVIALGLPCVVLLGRMDPTDLADGLAQVWRLPHRFVLGALAAFRLTGRLSRDWRSMELARRARGLGDSRALRRLAGLSFAVLVTAVRRGSELATAMESRGFGRPGRTWARLSRRGPID
ncbi:MAG: ATP-binding cassette domain-containing protein, partial [Propionibacteriaceae bacterium]|nr:ATP-binding cassette domain-containing protein [Propionibacteriaceae bacterium]